MEQIVVIGGMGAGKSSVSRMLADCGLPLVDLDKVGHEALALPEVVEELAAAFGADVADEAGVVRRDVVAQRAFADPESTEVLNAITLPRIGMLYERKLAELEAQGHAAVVAEFSSFRSRSQELARGADVLIAVVAPIEQRVARAVAAGWDEADVRARIERQITDEERIAAADVVFCNTGSLDEIRQQVEEWWHRYRSSIE